jgi:transglutaminase-like putative cysteine protease
VLRVKILDGAPLNNLKWRGGTLRYFDGARWSNPPSLPRLLDNAQGHYVVGRLRSRTRPAVGSFLRYRVLRAAMDCDTVFLPGTPQILEGEFWRLEMSEADAISVPGSRWRPLRYEGWSFVGPSRPAEPSDLEGPFQTRIRSRYLQLPQLDPRIPALARHVTENESSPYSRAAALERYLRMHFSYTLELPPEPPADPLANFLFERKKGHCEYFASAMAVMLRTLGIPSRIADGFQSGPYNPISGYYTVRASEAHAWVEAYFAGLGWVTFDPTPAEPLAEGLLGRSWQYLDALETFWNDWIVQYDLSRQVNLARSVQIEWYKAAFLAIERVDRSMSWVSGRWERWKQAPRTALFALLEILTGFLAIALAIWAAPLLRAWRIARRVKQGRGSDEDCALLYLRALEQMRRRGFIRKSSQTPEEFTRAVQPPECSEPAARLLARITSAYSRSRFGGDRKASRELPQLIHDLEILPR